VGTVQLHVQGRDTEIVGLQHPTVDPDIEGVLGERSVTAPGIYAAGRVHNPLMPVCGQKGFGYTSGGKALEAGNKPIPGQFS